MQTADELMVRPFLAEKVSPDGHSGLWTFWVEGSGFWTFGARVTRSSSQIFRGG